MIYSFISWIQFQTKNDQLTAGKQVISDTLQRENKIVWSTSLKQFVNFIVILTGTRANKHTYYFIPRA